LLIIGNTHFLYIFNCVKKDKIIMTAIFIINIDRTIKQEALYKKQSIV